MQLSLGFLVPPQPTGPAPSSPAASTPGAAPPTDWNQIDEAARGAALALLATLIARRLAAAATTQTIATGAGHE
jgi:hypothetical protein